MNIRKVLFTFLAQHLYRICQQGITKENLELLRLLLGLAREVRAEVEVNDELLKINLEKLIRNYLEIYNLNS